MPAPVTVIVPVYNVKDHLAKCLESLRAQTLADLEVIVVLDAPTDGSAKVARQYEDHERVRVVELSQNVGPAQARNIGLHYANGDFVGFVDADDWVDPDMYAKLFLAAHSDSADIASCGYRRVAPDGAATDVPFPITSADLADTDGIRQALSQGHANRMLWFAVRNIFRRSILEVDPFDPDLRMGEDVLFNLRAFGAARRGTVIEDTLYFYREVPNSLTMSTTHNPALAKGLQMAYDRKLAIARQMGLSQAFTDDTRLYTIDNLLPRLLANALRTPEECHVEAVAGVLQMPMVRESIDGLSICSPLPSGQRIILALAKAHQVRLLTAFMRSRT